MHDVTNARGAPPAGNGQRFVAHLIDSFAWVIAIAVVSPTVGLLVLVAWIGLWVVVAAGGMSPGKKVMGLVCLDLTTGQPATLGKMVVRDLLAKTLLGAFTCGITGLIGAIQIVGNDRRRALWDTMTDTVVVERSSLGSPPRVAAGVPSPAAPVLPPPPPVVPTAPAAADPPVGDIEIAHAAEAITVPEDAGGLDDLTVSRTDPMPVATTAPATGVVVAPTWTLSPSWDLDRSITGPTTVIVGRDPGVVPAGAEAVRTAAGDSAVSRTHCALHFGDELRVEDLGSRNGTIVERPDGTTVALRPHEVTVLPDGSRIVLGDHSMAVRRA